MKTSLNYPSNFKYDSEWFEICESCGLKIRWCKGRSRCPICKVFRGTHKESK